MARRPPDLDATGSEPVVRLRRRQNLDAEVAAANTVLDCRPLAALSPHAVGTWTASYHGSVAARTTVPDSRDVADLVAMSVATAFERRRNVTTFDIHEGNWVGVDSCPHAATVSSCFSRKPDRRSADLVSVGKDIRIIEVKGRGSKGPVVVPERELDTLRCAGHSGWLYVVWYATQPQPVELWVVRDAGALTWLEESPAQRPSGRARGVRHEARFSINVMTVEQEGDKIGLPELVLTIAHQLKSEAYERGKIRHRPL